MGHARRERVADALREEIAGLLRHEVRDPRVGFVTLTGVEVSPDLSHARVFITVLGDEEARSNSLEALNGASGFLQRQIFKRLRLKKALMLTFQFDNAVQSGIRIEELLGQIHGAPGQEEE
jgi:ribosome-binding factor A